MINEEIRIQWTGTARHEPRQAEWAVGYARVFASSHAPDRERKTGLRRCALLTGGCLTAEQAAYVYFTKGGIVVVRIHGNEL